VGGALMLVVGVMGSRGCGVKGGLSTVLHDDGVLVAGSNPRDGTTAVGR